jgi:hypothetical protein
MWCAIKSAATANANIPVCVYTKTLSAALPKRMKLPNVYLVKLDFDDLFSGTALEKWYLDSKKRQPMHGNPLSDAVRLAILYKFGGAYLDLDVISLKPLFTSKPESKPILPLNALATQADPGRFLHETCDWDGCGGDGKEWETVEDEEAAQNDDELHSDSESIAHVYYLDGPLHPLALLQDRGEEVEVALTGVSGAITNRSGNTARLLEYGDATAECDKIDSEEEKRNRVCTLSRYAEQEQCIEQMTTWARYEMSKQAQILLGAEKQAQLAALEAKAAGKEVVALNHGNKSGNKSAEEVAREKEQAKALAQPDHTSPVATLLPLVCTGAQHQQPLITTDADGNNPSANKRLRTSELDVLPLHRPGSEAEVRERRGYIGATMRRLARRKVVASYSVLAAVGGYDPIGRGMDACAVRKPMAEQRGGETRAVLVRCSTVQLHHPAGRLHARDFVITDALAASASASNTDTDRVELNPHYTTPHS